MGTGFPKGSCLSKRLHERSADAKPNGNSRRDLDVGRRRGLRARDGQTDWRGAAAAVIVSSWRRGAGKRRCGRTGGGADLEAAQRAVAGRRRRHAPRHGRVPERALLARRRQAAAAGLGQDRRHLQDARPALRAAAHQFQASPRRRLQGSKLQARARRRAGRAAAMGWRSVRNRGLCPWRCRRHDAFA